MRRKLDSRNYFSIVEMFYTLFQKPSGQCPLTPPKRRCRSWYVIFVTMVGFLFTVSTFGEASPKSPYLIGIEDVLEVSVWPHHELDKELIVRSDGRVTFPPVGEIEAEGLQPKELGDIITNGLKLYYIDPKVFIRVKESNSQKVVILGQVRNPGLFRPESQIDLVELISLAGGVIPTADLERCMVLRKREVIPIDLRALLFQGDLKNNLLLEKGDQVIIPKEVENQIFVLGDVDEPGAYGIKQGEEMSLKKALARAGGPLKYNVLDKVSVLRGEETISLNLHKLLVENDLSQDISIEPNDTIFVPPLTENKVVVVGEIQRPGVYQLGDGLTVLTAIARAGGYTDDAVLKNARVVRTGSELETIPVDLERIVRHGEMNRDIPLEPGDVVFIPKSTAANVSYVIQRILGPLQLLLTGEQIFYFSTRLAENE